MNSAYGGAVYFPPGEFLVSSVITISIANTCTIGAGRFCSNIIVNTHTFYIFNVTVPQCTFSSFTVTGQNPASGGTYYYVINDSTGNSAYSLRLNDLAFNQIHSGVLTSSPSFYMEGCYMTNICTTFGVGVTITGPGEVRSIVNCIFENSSPTTNARAGVLILQGSSHTLMNVQLIKMGNCLWIEPGGGQIVYSVKCIDLWCDTSTGIGILLNGSTSPIERVNVTGGWMSFSLYGVQIKGASA